MGGLYPSLCLVNASCDQNISHYNDGTEVVAVAARDIKEGEEVCDNYFPSSLVMSRGERRAWLNDHYWYHCQCCACTADTPPLVEMKKCSMKLRQQCKDSPAWQNVRTKDFAKLSISLPSV